MNCINCGTRTAKAPDGSEYYCYICNQSAIEILAVMPDRSTMPELKAEPLRLSMARELMHTSICRVTR